MGKPSLIMNNSLSSNITFMKFLFKREWRDLDDSGLATLSKSMLVFFATYIVGFLALFFSVPLGYAP
jgi:ABC-type phosphate transport system permease subunit